MRISLSDTSTEARDRASFVKVMLPTPSTSHVNYDHIYEPSEDSYLLLDTLSASTETTFLHSRFPSNTTAPLVLEVGTGSGVVLALVTAHAMRIFGRSDVTTLGLDVNEFACAATVQTVQLSVKEAKATSLAPGVFLDCVCGDLTSAIRPRSVDVLIFNPPYVPSETVPATLSASDQTAFDRDLRLSYLATDGGADGMEVTNRLLDELPSILSERGIAYVLLCAQNQPEMVMARIKAWSTADGRRWYAQKVGTSGKKAGWEKLCVIRIWRED